MISIIYQLPSLWLRSQLFSHCFFKIKVLFYLAAWRQFTFSLAFGSIITIFLGIIFFIFSYVAFETLLESMAWYFSAVLKNYLPLSLQILFQPHSLFFLLGLQLHICFSFLCPIGLLCSYFPLSLHILFWIFFYWLVFQFTNYILAMSNPLLNPSINF